MQSSSRTILQKVLISLAKTTLKRYRPGIIGITGNVGKTSAKEAIRTVFERDRNVRSSPKNFNTEIGLSLTILGGWKDTGGAFFYIKVILIGVLNLIWKRRSYPEVLILEYGADRPGDMKRLLEIARPHIGVVTAIGAVPSHVEFFAGPEAVVREKGKLIAALPATGFAILNHDEREIHAMKEGTRAHAITFGSAEDADVRITNTETILRDGMPETAFKITYGGSLVPVRLKGVMGMPHAYAAVTAAAVALAFGMHLVKIAEALGEYTAPNGRMKVIHGVKGSTVLDDTYNAAPSSVRAALDALKTVRAKRKIAVLGDMLELGEYTIPAHKAIGEFAASHIKILITVGDKAKFIAEAAEKAGLSKKNIFVYSGLREASYELKRMIEHGDLVLVKGSQAVRMEKIVREIIEKPEDADELLVRQSPRWLDTPGMYDE